AEHLGKKKKEQFLVGFSLETDDDDARPIEKMKNKNCDMMVVNRLDTSLGGDSSVARIIYPDKPADSYALQSKRDLAARIIERIAANTGNPHG
ncbi:MAG: phosphopantothenoylcysteine decarboxylase, partial [Chitinivibrionales bacterium]